jgi:hypothetical protein
MKTLQEMVGTEILVVVRGLGTAMQLVKLHAVEDAGLWIESESLTQALLEGLGKPASEDAR